MQIQLGSHTFELASGTFVTKQPLIEYPQHLRTTGQQERGGQTLMSNWWLENFESGYNTDRIDLASERMKSSFWDSTADTIHRGQVTNPREPIAIPAATYTVPFAVYEWDNETFGIVRHSGGFTQRNFGYYRADYGDILKYSGTSWEYYGSMQVSSLDITKTNFARNIDYVGGRPALTMFWGSAGNYDREQVVVLTPTPALYEGVTGLSSARYFDRWVWANTTQAVVGVPTTQTSLLAFADGGTIGPRTYFGHGGGLQNMRMFQGQDGYEGLFLFYRNKITCWENFFYNRDENEIDSSEIPYLDLFGLEDENNMDDVVVFNGNLCFQVQDALLAYAPDGSVMDIGMNMFSGMPPDKQGKIEALCSSVRHLFAMLNQNGVRQIYCFDGQGWHWFGQTPTMNNTATSFGRMFMVTHPSGRSQLMALAEGNATAYAFDYPDANPVWLPDGATLGFATVSSLVTPEFDGGLPNQKGVAYKLSVEGDFDADNTVSCYYSTLGRATGWASLGQATQGGRTTFDFGTLGLPHDIIQFKFDFAGSATTTPILRTAVLDYLKFPDVRDVYTFTVDLVKTYNENLASVQSGLDSLASIRDSFEMVPFKYGDNATVNVKVLEMPAQEEHVTADDEVYGTIGMAALVTMRAVKLL